VTLVATGATQLRNVFTAEQMPGILTAYIAGINAAFAISIAAVGLSFIIALLGNWKRLNLAH